MSSKKVITGVNFSKGLEAVKARFDKLPRRSMKVEEWGMTVYWKPMTLDVAADFNKRVKANEGDAASRLIVNMLEDEEGNRLFKQGEHVELLRSVAALSLSRIAIEIIQDEPLQTKPEQGEE